MEHCETSLTQCPLRSLKPRHPGLLARILGLNFPLGTSEPGESHPSTPFLSSQTNLQPPTYAHHSTQSQPMWIFHNPTSPNYKNSLVSVTFFHISSCRCGVCFYVLEVWFECLVMGRDGFVVPSSKQGYFILSSDFERSEKGCLFQAYYMTISHNHITSFKRKRPLTKFLVQNNTKADARFGALIPNVRNTYNPYENKP